MVDRRTYASRGLQEPHELEGIPYLDDMPGDSLGGIAANKHKAYLMEEKRKLTQTFLDTCLIPMRTDKIQKAQTVGSGS